MTMESQLTCLNPNQRTHIIKGKRTKRPRPLSPIRPVTSTSSCGGDDSFGDVSDHARIDTNNNLYSSPSSAIEVHESGGGEEEDMANCLILLAEGNHHHRRQKTSSPETTKTSYIYHCKTCNKCFSSFQALGGHRASHKKPNIKISSGGDNQRKVTDDGEDEEHSLNDKQSVVTNETRSIFSNMNTTLSLQISNNMIKSNKVHECSICGTEFSSGQALGGHMRRHRTATTARLVTGSLEDDEHKKPRRDNLQLDLNLPAPLEDNDYRESKFLFGSKEQVLVFSPSNLVDCHY